MKKYVIVYTCGGDDLSTEEFDTREEVDAWLDENNYKAYVLEVDKDFDPEDRT